MTPRLSRIKDWEALARDADFQPRTMADLCHISLRQLERFFVGHAGKSPGEWTRELKCRLARELIGKGYSTKAVAAELKFASESHLCHEFKRIHGVSPQRFAPSYRSNLEQLSSRSGDAVLSDAVKNGPPQIAAAPAPSPRRECAPIRLGSSPLRKPT